MLTRLAGRALTGPLAFLLAGVLDVAAFSRALAREWLKRRLSAARPGAPR